MHRQVTNPDAAPGRVECLSRIFRRFLGIALLAGLIAALFFVVYIGGCRNEDPGIVNVCIEPTVIRTSPVDGEKNVLLNSTNDATGIKIITATFSTPMNSNSLTIRTFTIQQGSTTLSGTVSCSDTSAFFIAPNNLVANRTYTCMISTGARDAAGTSLAADYVWSFTTMAPPTAPILAAPVDAAINIAINPTLRWNVLAGANTYRLQVSTSSNFAAMVYNDSTRTNTSQLISGLTVGTTYYWR